MEKEGAGPYGLISVSEKDGIEKAARGLVESGLSLLSTGGTARYLVEKGFPVTPLEEVTSFPEILEGRVKTLHPQILGPLLAQPSRETHQRDIKTHHLPSIPLVIVNLYPFEEAVEKEGVSEEEALENIDIGGITLLRAAAKNYREIAVITDPGDYHLAGRWRELSLEERRELALKAWERVLQYDRAILEYFQKNSSLQNIPSLVFGEPEELSYGENPHQKGFLVPDLRLGSQKKYWEVRDQQLSYNNHLDISSALFALSLLEKKAAVVVKHSNPCGGAVSDNLEEALKMAWQGDSRSAYGGIVAVNQPMNKGDFSFFKGKFIDVLCAPAYSEELVEHLARKGSRLKVISFDPGALRDYYSHNLSVKSLPQGFLMQSWDWNSQEKWECPTEEDFPEELKSLARFGIRINQGLLSNGISLVSQWKGSFWQSGMGAGQSNRVGSLENLALPLFARNCKELAESEGMDLQEMRQKLLEKTVLVSDGFFPFADSIERAAGFGLRYIIQPGGSKRDEEVILACNKLGVSMILTGVRHFRHG